MSGWFPTPAAGWPVTLERLQRLGEPITESEAITDLRWHVDQRVPLPGRRELRKRWGGWSERAIRDLLADTERWWDTATQGPAPSSRADLEARAPVAKRMVIPDASRSVPGRVPVCSRSEADEPTEPGTDDPGLFPDASRSVPGRVHARAPTHPAPSPSPSPGTTPPPAEVALDDAPTVVDPPRERPPDRFEEAAAYWGEIVHRQIGRRPSHGPSRNTKLGQRLVAAMRRDPELVLDAMRFVAESQTERAQHLRAYDGLTIDTVLRHVDEYAELWRAHGDRPRAGPGPPRRGQSTAGDGVLAEARRRLRQEADRGDGGRRDGVLGGPRVGGAGEALGDPGGGDPFGERVGGGSR